MSAHAGTAPAPFGRAKAIVTSWPAVLLFLAALTWYSLQFRTEAISSSFWMDEGLSVGIASYPIGDIPAMLKHDGSPPLYYMLLSAWMGAFGRSEAYTHMLSLLAAMTTVPVSFVACWRLFDRRTGVIAAMLFASSVFLTIYAQETRMYALMALLSLTTSLLFVTVFVARRRAWLPLFVLSLAAMLYTHGWGIFFGIGCGAAFLFLLARGSVERRQLMIDGLIGFGAVALLFLPWVPTLLYQSAHTGAPWAKSPRFGFPIQISEMMGGQKVVLVLIVGSLLGLVRVFKANGEGAVVDARLRGSLDDGQVRRSLEVLLLIFGMTVAVAWTVSQFNPAWVLRYLAAILGPLLLIFAICAARAGWVGLVAVTFGTVAAFAPSVNSDVNLKSNVRNIGSELKGKLKPGTLVIVGQPEQVPLAWYYLPGGMRWADSMGPTSDPRMLNWVDVVDRLRKTDPKAEWNRLAATVPVGGQVLLIRPLTVGISNWSAPWTFLVRHRSAQWSAALRDDPRFEREASAPSYYIPASTVADSAVLYRRVAGR